MDIRSKKGVSMIRHKRSFFVEFWLNLALVSSIVYGLVAMTYAAIKQIFPLWYYLVGVFVIVAYAVYWGIQHDIGKIPLDI